MERWGEGAGLQRRAGIEKVEGWLEKGDGKDGERGKDGEGAGMEIGVEIEGGTWMERG